MRRSLDRNPRSAGSISPAVMVPEPIHAWRDLQWQVLARDSLPDRRAFAVHTEADMRARLDQRPLSATFRRCRKSWFLTFVARRHQAENEEQRAEYPHPFA